MLIFVDPIYSVLFNTGNLPSIPLLEASSFSFPAIVVGLTLNTGSLWAEPVSDQKMETEYLNCWATPKQ